MPTASAILSLGNRLERLVRGVSKFRDLVVTERRHQRNPARLLMIAMDVKRGDRLQAHMQYGLLDGRYREVNGAFIALEIGENEIRWINVAQLDSIEKVAGEE